jgi:orotidine-5'-phosphate decarboxylase
LSPARVSPVIVALDVSSGAAALALVEACGGKAGMFKVGNQLFMAEGPDIVRAIVECGERVFLDMKFHDIPNTVSSAALECGRLGVSMMTIHAAGGGEMIRATRERLDAECGDHRPRIVAVTVLTSLDERSLRAIGVDAGLRDQVSRLAQTAVDSGADGVVCSPEEIRLLREELGQAPTIVTPGVRMPGQSVDDQKRVRTPKQAVVDGANWIVVGRYVNRADDPGTAIQKILDSLSAN